MAFLKEEDYEKQQASTAQPLLSDPNAGAAPLAQDQGGSSAPMEGQGIGAPMDGGTAGQTGAQQQQQQQAPSSGSFTNIQRYAEKNQPQAQQMAQEVTGKVSQAQDDSNRAIREVVDKFKTQAQ